tara:strand:+ start:124 stop:813 length:690 start_codon:yes stop_codon:yes gene_type:complete
MSNPILIPRCVLELYTIASQDENRHNLNCIYITKSEQVVTNGHQLVMLKTELEDRDQQFDRVPSKSIQLPNDVVKSILKGSQKGTKLKGMGSIFELEITSECNCTITRTDPNGTKLALQFNPDGCGSFPDYNQVIPNESTKENPKAFGEFWEADQRRIGLNLELMSVVFTYLKRIKASHWCGFKFIDDLSPIASTQEIECQPYRTEYANGETPWTSQLTWILMPCRVTP